MVRFVDVGGCPVPTGQDFHVAVRYVVRRVGANPTTVYRGEDPLALRIMHAHGKHSQRELYEATAAQRVAWDIEGTPNAPGTSTHELRSAGIFSASLTDPIPDYQCGMDWPDGLVPTVIAAFGQLGMSAFRPYPASGKEYHHVCCRRPPRLTTAQRLYVQPLTLGHKGELVRGAQILMHRGGFYRGAVARRVGTYGPTLARAVERFQAQAGLRVDGAWGPDTYAAAEQRWGR